MGSTSKDDVCKTCKGTGLKDSTTVCPDCNGTASKIERERLDELATAGEEATQAATEAGVAAETESAPSDETPAT